MLWLLVGSKANAEKALEEPNELLPLLLSPIADPLLSAPNPWRSVSEKNPDEEKDCEGEANALGDDQTIAGNDGRLLEFG